MQLSARKRSERNCSGVSPSISLGVAVLPSSEGVHIGSISHIKRDHNGGYPTAQRGNNNWHLPIYSRRSRIRLGPLARARARFWLRRTPCWDALAADRASVTSRYTMPLDMVNRGP